MEEPQIAKRSAEEPKKMEPDLNCESIIRVARHQKATIDHMKKAIKIADESDLNSDVNCSEHRLEKGSHFDGTIQDIICGRGGPGQLRSIKLLVQAGADVNFNHPDRPGNNQSTLQYCLIHKTDLDVVEYLLEQGLSVNNLNSMASVCFKGRHQIQVQLERMTLEYEKKDEIEKMYLIKLISLLGRHGVRYEILDVPMANMTQFARDVIIFQASVYQKHPDLKNRDFLL